VQALQLSVAPVVGYHDCCCCCCCREAPANMSNYAPNGLRLQLPCPPTAATLDKKAPNFSNSENLSSFFFFFYQEKTQEAYSLTKQ